MNSQKEKEIKKIVEKLLFLWGEEKAKAKIDFSGEELEIKINSEKPEFLVGHHGKTLEALQLLLKMMIFSKSKEWLPIVVNVNDYREKQRERVIDLAQKAASEVEVSQRPVYLPPMSPFERRLIHLALADHPLVGSASEGEGENRRVVVKLKSSL